METVELDREAHRLIHKKWDENLRKLISDLKLPFLHRDFFDGHTVMDLMNWSNEQAEQQQNFTMHQMLDRLVADFFDNTDKLPSETKLTYFFDWSLAQSYRPDHVAMVPKKSLRS